MEKNMQIHIISIHDIRAYENNPRKIPEEAIDKVANSIKEFGFKVPVILDKDNIIVAGHTRILAAKKLNIEEIPCIIADDLTDEQIKAFRLADNKLSELSGWDFEKLDIELEELDFNMSDFGFNLDLSENEELDINSFLTKAEPEIESENTPIASTVTVPASNSDAHVIICPECGAKIKI